MKHLFLFVILLTVSATAIGAIAVASDSAADFQTTAKPVISSTANSPIDAEMKLAQEALTVNDLLTGDASHWFGTHERTSWTVEELRILREILVEVIDALNTVDVDGNALLGDYRFRRDPGHYADSITGRMAKVDHNEMVITLSDTSFLRQQGFTIYHELGHAVDFRLGRNLSAGFHHLVGSDEESSELTWKTADNFWIRQEGRDDREEAAADAFAVWVMVEHAGLQQPVFPRAPISTDYDGIAQAVETVLKDLPSGSSSK